MTGSACEIARQVRSLRRRVRVRAARARARSARGRVRRRAERSQVPHGARSPADHVRRPADAALLRGESLPLSLIHISEPTRLLSISYAVFCLKKKKKI